MIKQSLTNIFELFDTICTDSFHQQGQRKRMFLALHASLMQSILLFVMFGAAFI
jgi:hypothetical protein